VNKTLCHYVLKCRFCYTAYDEDENYFRIINKASFP